MTRNAAVDSISSRIYGYNEYICFQLETLNVVLARKFRFQLDTLDSTGGFYFQLDTLNAVSTSKFHFELESTFRECRSCERILLAAGRPKRSLYKQITLSAVPCECGFYMQFLLSAGHPL